MIDDSRPVARPVIHKWSVDNRRSWRTVDDSATAVCDRSLDWSLDRIRHEWIVVHGSSISRPFDRSLHHVGYDRVIAILSRTIRFEWILHDALRCASRL